MGNPQKVKYKDVDDLFAQLPEDEREIVLRLRSIILETLPQVREKLAFNVPFYYLKKRIAFIWPASVPWGGISEGVALGFTQGFVFENQAFFDKTNHKKIRQILYQNIGEIDIGVVKMLILEAAEI